MSGYCDIAPGHEFHGPYHDREYGFPTEDEIVLFERLSLEIMQAGLSWLIVLKKRKGMNAAFAGFDPKRVAEFGARDVERLLADENIVRNRLKIEASHGSFAGWLAAHHPRSKEAWVKLFRKTFKFTGPEVVNEFLMSIGYLPGAHRADCPAHKRIAKLKPPHATV